MIVKILIAVLIFGITVIIHELGHFLLAAANGITVTEFSIGFGPTVVKTEKGETIYSLKLLPFGGARRCSARTVKRRGKEQLTANPCGQEFPSLRRDRCST